MKRTNAKKQESMKAGMGVKQRTRGWEIDKLILKTWETDREDCEEHAA